MKDWERKLFKPEVVEMLDKGTDPILVYAIMKSRKEMKELMDLIRADPSKELVGVKGYLVQELIESCERKAFDAGRETIQGEAVSGRISTEILNDPWEYESFNDYKASPEYLSEEIAKDGNP